MKNFFFFLFLCMTNFCLAQKDVTKFLGIPVDGFKPEMIKKLEAKGYVFHPEEDYLTGEFNGQDVHIRILTNNNKVWRIMVSDANCVNETSIKIKFNKLCRQFEKNKKYIPTGFKEQIIPEEEDISYEMTVKSKRYEAAFFQVPNEADSLEFMQQIRGNLLEKYTEEELSDTTQNRPKGIESDTIDLIYDAYAKKSVWFMISEFYGKYYINLYYDNEYNHADGEDL